VSSQSLAGPDKQGKKEQRRHKILKLLFLATVISLTVLQLVAPVGHVMLDIEGIAKKK
jgi:hypothetical protein